MNPLSRLSFAVKALEELEKDLVEERGEEPLELDKELELALGKDLDQELLKDDQGVNPLEKLRDRLQEEFGKSPDEPKPVAAPVRKPTPGGGLIKRRTPDAYKTLRNPKFKDYLNNSRYKLPAEHAEEGIGDLAYTGRTNDGKS